MKRKIFARLTDDGTAAAETAVCEEHFALSPEAEDAKGGLVRCIGNDALECVLCGARDDAQYIVVSGNPVDGTDHAGPFGSAEEAGQWAEENGGDEWWIVALTSPETD